MFLHTIFDLPFKITAMTKMLISVIEKTSFEKDFFLNRAGDRVKMEIRNLFTMLISA